MKGPLPKHVLQNPTPTAFTALFETVALEPRVHPQLRQDLTGLRLTLDLCEGAGGYREWELFRATGGSERLGTGLRVGWCTVGRTRYVRIENWARFHGGKPPLDFTFWHGTLPERAERLNEQLVARFNTLLERRFRTTRQTHLQPAGRPREYRSQQLPYEFRSPRLVAATPEGLLLANNRWAPTRGLLIVADAMGVYREHLVPRRFINPKTPMFRNAPARQRLRAAIAWLFAERLAGKAA